MNTLYHFKNKIYFRFHGLHIEVFLFLIMFSGYFTSVGSAFIKSSALLSLWISTTVSKTNIIGDFWRLIGQKGQKGHLYGPVFFPGHALNFACKSCAWLNRKQVMHIKRYLFTKFLGYGVHLFIYGTKRAAF